MAKRESKGITYREFMKQVDKVRAKMGKEVYERLEAKFGSRKSYKTV